MIASRSEEGDDGEAGLEEVEEEEDDDDDDDVEAWNRPSQPPPAALPISLVIAASVDDVAGASLDGPLKGLKRAHSSIS